MVGSATVRDCLVNGTLHRAVAVLVIRRNGSVLLQQRSMNDAWQPGLWTLSCTGHVKKGETYEEAGERELWEELRLRSPLEARSKRRIPPIRGGILVENEWVQLFVTRTESEVLMDPVEVQAVKEFTTSELEALVARGPFTPDARILLGEYVSSPGTGRS